MKREFKSAEALKLAAKRRGFTLPEELDPPAPLPMIEPVPDPDPLPPLLPQDGMVDAIQETLQLHAQFMREATRQNQHLIEAAVQRFTATPPLVEGRTPAGWRVTVTSRDYEGRIIDLDIKPVSSTESGEDNGV